MRFYQNSKAEFIHFFGEESLNLIEGHDDVLFIIARRGMFPEVEHLGPVSGFVTTLNETTLQLLPQEGPSTIALVIFPENIHEETRHLPADFRDRYRRSTLVHEMTHVTQQKEGRLSQVKAGTITWEGKAFDLSNLKGYVEWPWEREAYLNQMTYLANGDTAMGENHYNAMVAFAKATA